ncbi:hypothetical protein JCM6882_001492 [Rhodosporidiobolus microsporus]
MSEPATSPSAPRPPRRTINDLPVELKQRIVQLCAEQDEWYNLWLWRTKRHPRFAGARRQVGVPKIVGRSVRALFEVSKQFSELAAPHIFQRLSSDDLSNASRSSLVENRIGAFQSFRLDDAGAPDLDRVRAVLPQLLGLRSLEIMGYRDAWVFNRPWTPHEPPMEPTKDDPHAWMTLFRRLPSLFHLSLSHVSMSAGVFISTLSATTLRSLRITVSVLHVDNLDLLAPVLSAAGNLELLHLICDDDHTNHLLDLTSLRDSITVLPPLKHLFITTVALHPSHLSFANTFSASLRSLALSPASPELAHPPIHVSPPFTSETFPAITSLMLECIDWRAAEALFSSITSQNFPSVKSLTFVFYHDDEVRGIASIIARFPTLTTLNLPRPEDLTDGERTAVTAYCQSRSIRLISQPGSGNPFPEFRSDWEDVADDLVLKESTFDDEVAAARATLEYLGRRLEDAQRTGDWRVVQRLTQALRSGQEERVKEDMWERV